MEPTCYGEGANEDPSFASTELECNQTYCREQTGDPVVLPWSMDAAPPCRTALGNACGTQLDEGNFTYRVEVGPFSLEFSFDPRLGQDGFTDEAFTARFVSLTMLGMRGGSDATTRGSQFGSPGLPLGALRRPLGGPRAQRRGLLVFEWAICWRRDDGHRHASVL